MKTNQKIDLHQLIMDQMSDGMLFVDSTGSIATANQSAGTILSRSQADLIGARLDQIFNLEKLGFSLSNALQGKDIPEQVDIEMGLAILEVRPSIVTENGTTGLILLIRDVTKARQRAAQIHRKNQLEELERFASIVNHDLKNPLGGMKGFATLLSRDLEEGSKEHMMSEKICQAVDDLSLVLQQIVDYAKAPVLTFKEEDIGSLINEVIESLPEDKKTTMTFNQPEQKLTAEVDRAQLQRALTGLFLGVESQGTIGIELTQKGRNILLSVEGHEIEMDNETKKRIFLPLFRANNEGCDISLAEVKRMVEAHQGALDLTSELDEGVKFIITLPRTHEN